MPSQKPRHPHFADTLRPILRPGELMPCLGPAERLVISEERMAVEGKGKEGRLTEQGRICWETILEVCSYSIPVCIARLDLLFRFARCFNSRRFLDSVCSPLIRSCRGFVLLAGFFLLGQFALSSELEVELYNKSLLTPSSPSCPSGSSWSTCLPLPLRLPEVRQ